MSNRRWLVALLFVIGITPAFAQENKPVSMAWKFEKGKPFFQEMTTETTQTMKVQGSDVKQTQKQTFIYGWTPGEQDKDKNTPITQKIEGVKMEIDIGGNKISYDSTNPTAAAGNTLAEFFKSLLGNEFKMILTPDMKILKIEGRDDFIKKLTTANPTMKTLLEQILSEEALKQMADPTFASLPGKEVKKGDSWERKNKLSMGPLGSYDVTYKYTYDGPEGKLEKIKVDTTLVYNPPDPAAPAGALPFKIKSAELKSTKGSGTILFNKEAGRVESSEMNLTLGGKLSIEIGGMTTDVDLAQEQKTTVKTSEKNPAEKK